jgi:S1-C subfamily serine protease
MTRRAAVLAVLMLSLSPAACSDAYSPPTPLRVTVATTGLTDDVATAVPAGSDRVLTVAHVVAGARSVRVGNRPARVVDVDRRLDLAVLEVHGLRAPRPHYAQAGDDVVVHVLRQGRPRTISARLRRRVSAEIAAPQRHRIDVRPALELTASVLPGDSGAPVTDSRGRIVGLIFARAVGTPDTAWALDVGAL